MSELKIETRGRPKLPETIIKELQLKILELEHEAATSSEPFKEMEKMAEIVRILMRAMKGLGADDDVFQGLINAKDIRERTRLDEKNLLGHSAMRIAADRFPIMSMFGAIADMEDPYFISQDGEGRKEGILLQQAKTKMDGNMILNMPNTQGGVAQTEQPQAQGQPQKKKGFFDKVLRR